MLCDLHPFTLEETLASLDYFVEAYFDSHNVWMTVGDGPNDRGRPYVEARSACVYDFVRTLYPYVYEKHFDLGATDFRYYHRWDYPHFDGPEQLMIAAVQLYSLLDKLSRQ